MDPPAYPRQAWPPADAAIYCMYLRLERVIQWLCSQRFADPYRRGPNPSVYAGCADLTPGFGPALVRLPVHSHRSYLRIRKWLPFYFRMIVSYLAHFVSEHLRLAMDTRRTPGAVLHYIRRMSSRSERTVLRWMRKAPRNPEPARRWAAFLSNHRETIAAMDFFTVPTIIFGLLYGFFVIAHDRRCILHLNVTRHPTST